MPENKKKDTSVNLSKIQRTEMLSTLEGLKNTNPEQMEAINKIITFVKSQKYGLNFEHHEEAVDVLMRDHLPVLKPFKEIREKPKSGDYNFLLEGDNLHSLKLLQKTHRGRIDIIYIDPPYNTLNDDFVYGDKMMDEEDGFRHSKWLSFMKERLEIARELLSEQGVIFISIDDNEQAQLKLLCDGVFGEPNIEAMIWNKIPDFSTAGHGKMKIINRFRTDHEYIMVCYKNKKNTLFDKPLEIPNWKTQYPNKDNDPRGPWCDGELSKSEAKSNPKGKNYYTILTPSGLTSYSRQWHCSLEEFKEYLADNRIWWGSNGENCPRLKKFQNVPAPTTPTSVIKNISQTDGNDDFYDVLEENANFDNPKPVQLLKWLLRLIPKKDATVIDFFAGSGTTAQAVLELNAEDGGNRHFILCTNNEVSASRCLDYIHYSGYMLDMKASGKNKTTQAKIDKFFAENPDVYQKLMVDGHLEYEKYGICQAVTFQRIRTVIMGIRPDGSKYSDGIPANLKYLQTDMVDKYERGEDGRCLPYIREELRDELCGYIETLIELQDGISLPDDSVAVIWDSIGVSELMERDLEKLRTVYIDIDSVETTAQQENFLEHLRNRGVVFRNIPKYYYKEVQ